MQVQSDNHRKFFRKRLMAWHDPDKRKMPWKGEKDPYKIWISEIMLQQTRVEQAEGYYRRFVRQFPNADALARAGEDEVLKHWSGLGYYSRAHHLMEAARYIRDQLHGRFPGNYEELLKLKGVGTYTAAAIASFAYGEEKAVLDGNVIRVLSRYFAIREPVDKSRIKQRLFDLAQDLIKDQDPAKFNQALMDFGATVCKPVNPDCDICPLAPKCQAFEENLVSVIPYKSQRIKRTEEHLYLFMYSLDDCLLLQKRDKSDIWKGLHHPPSYTGSGSKMQSTTDLPGQIEKMFERVVDLEHLADLKWDLTHKRLHLHISELKGQLRYPLPPDMQMVPKALFTDYAFPAVIRRFLNDYMRSRRLSG